MDVHLNEMDAHPISKEGGYFLCGVYFLLLIPVAATYQNHIRI